MIVQADLRNPFGGRLLFPGLPDMEPVRVTCNVRTLRNKTRQAFEVVRTIPGGNPYDPMPFPAGSCHITGTSWQERDRFNENTYGPVKILTDAKQRVYTWLLDKEGDYIGPSGEMEEDSGYWLHFSISLTTLGCIRIGTIGDAVTVGRLVDKSLQYGEEIVLEVWR